MAYTPAEHIISHGKSIAYSATGGSPSYTQIFGTTDINFPETELGKAETSCDSSPDFTKEYIPGLYEPGEITFSYRYGKTQFAALETVFQLANNTSTRPTAIKLWKITLADGSTGVVKGFLTKHSLPAGEGEDVPTVECSIQCIGKMTFAAGETEE